MEARPAGMATAGTHYHDGAVTALVDIGAMASRPKKARHCLISVRGTDIRFLDDGSTPTATDGFPLLQDTDMMFSGDLKNLKLIPMSGSADITILWYR